MFEQGKCGGVKALGGHQLYWIKDW